MDCFLACAYMGPGHAVTIAVNLCVSLTYFASKAPFSCCHLQSLSAKVFPPLFYNDPCLGEEDYAVKTDLELALCCHYSLCLDQFCDFVLVTTHFILASLMRFERYTSLLRKTHLLVIIHVYANIDETGHQKT